MSEPIETGGNFPLPRSRRAAHRRRPPAIDMLPYAGVAFVLLCAFTLATEMARPQVMELIDPCPVDGCWEPFNISIYIRHDNALFLSSGYDSKVRTTSLAAIRELTEKKILDRNDWLLVTLFVDAAASYGRMADVLDELNCAESETAEAVRARYGGRVRRLRVLPMGYHDQLDVGTL